MASRHSHYQTSQIFSQPEPQPKTVPHNTDPKAYYTHSHASPYIDGKKNAQYVHPSLISNQVFYSQDSGPRNWPADNKRPLTASNEQYGKYTTQDNYRHQDNRPVTSSQQGGRRRESNDYDNGHEEEGRYRSGAGAKDDHRYDYHERDDRSEASALSSTGYLCPNCLNRHLYEDQKDLCRRQREEDMERERRIAEMNSRLSREEEEKNRFNRNQKVNEARGLREKLDRDYDAKLENRRSPKKESGSAFNNIFEKQDELREKTRYMNQAFRSSLEDQMRQSEQKKNKEKEWNSSPYGTSLQIGEGYHNKYLEGGPHNIKAALQDQVEEKTFKQRREREAEKILAQQKSEQELREQEEEERRRRENEWRKKNELKGHLLKTIEDHRSKKNEEITSKVNERAVIDQQYLDYKRRQAEEEERAKRQLFDYGRALHNQQENSSYKKQYEDKKHQKEVTSFDPSPTKSKKLYPCGECSVPYERTYLTKHH